MVELEITVGGRHIGALPGVRLAFTNVKGTTPMQSPWQYATLRLTRDQVSELQHLLEEARHE
jgi:hypothetical protein